MRDYPRITHVAIRLTDHALAGLHVLPAPNRHADIVYQLVRSDPELDYVTIEQKGEFGFLDEGGRFLNRKQALVIADINGQVKDKTKVLQGMLFSEALW